MKTYEDRSDQECILMPFFLDTDTLEEIHVRKNMSPHSSHHHMVSPLCHYGGHQVALATQLLHGGQGSHLRAVRV